MRDEELHHRKQHYANMMYDDNTSDEQNQPVFRRLTAPYGAVPCYIHPWLLPPLLPPVLCLLRLLTAILISENHSHAGKGPVRDPMDSIIPAPASCYHQHAASAQVQQRGQGLHAQPAGLLPAWPPGPGKAGGTNEASLHPCPSTSCLSPSLSLYTPGKIVRNAYLVCVYTICVCMYVCIYIYISLYIYIYICVYIHAYIHN